jgi:hypothetical protein
VVQWNRPFLACVKILGSIPSTTKDKTKTKIKKQTTKSSSELEHKISKMQNNNGLDVEYLKTRLALTFDLDFSCSPLVKSVTLGMGAANYALTSCPDNVDACLSLRAMGIATVLDLTVLINFS